MRDELLKLLEAEPFRPIRIWMTSGQQYAVHNPEMLVIIRDLAVHYAGRSDIYSILRLVQIAAVDIME